MSIISPQLIDQFLPTYDLAKHHRIDIQAPVEWVYTAVQHMDLGHSPIVRWLLLLRGLPSLILSPDRPKENRNPLTLAGLQKSGFILLGERPGRELLLGIVGRFWTPAGGILRIDAAEFQDFERSGYAKVAWSFSLSPRNDDITRLSTETRIQCLDAASRRRFRLYWLLVGPFSGLILSESLRARKRQAERPASIER